MTVDSLAGRRVALVGGAGFIGHHLALELHRRGAEVAVIDGLAVNNLLAFTAAPSTVAHRDLYLRFIHERLDLLRAAGVAIHLVDARDYLKLGTVFAEFRPAVIVHLAAVAHADRSNKDPFSTFDHSTRTLENALDYARARARAEHFIYFSSSMVYGNFRTEAVDEEHPLEPIGIYGALKVGGEKLVIAYHQVFGLPFTIVRPSALYGPRCVSRRVVQIFLETAMDGGRLRVAGDGAERLDFTYVDDLIQGLRLVVERPESRNQIFNLTYGASRSVADLAGIVRGAFPGVEVERVERDSLMPYRGTLSVEKARRLLGYAPAFPLEEGVARYAEWYRSIREDRPPARPA